jgi:hypothetical protein
MTALLALAATTVLIVFAGGYGYHRDELYFRRAGLDLAWGYIDQPPLTPLLARAMHELFGESLVGLRIPGALAAGLVVLLTGLIARELGASRGTQALAAAVMAVSAFLLAVGHLLSTATFDLLAWTALSWLLVRALRDGGPIWLAAGLVAGLGLLNKMTVAALLFGVGVGLLFVGPRRALRDRWLWLGVLLTLLVWAPQLVWQARHGWPQLEMTSVIAGGGTGYRLPRWLFLPHQLVLVSPLLVPIWVAGLVRLLRRPALRRYRSISVAYLVLAVLFLAVGGKPYYLAGMYPVLVAAGAEPTLRWVRVARTRAGVRLRAGLLGIALAVSAAMSAVLMLPLIPVQQVAATPVVNLNPNASESIGWPELAHSVSTLYTTLPEAERADAIALTGNYGEAGALDLYRTELALPPVYSGHNSYADWGPPPEAAGTTIAVGLDEPRLRRWFGSVRQVSRIDNGVGVTNEEQGRPVWLCRDRLAPWATIWPQLRRVG